MVAENNYDKFQIFFHRKLCVINSLVSYFTRNVIIYNIGMRGTLYSRILWNFNGFKSTEHSTIRIQSM